MRHVFAVIALGIIATSSAWALPPFGGPGVPYGPDAYQPYQPCANDGDCPAGKQCVNFRQVWDQWRGGFVWSGECRFVYGPPGGEPYGPPGGEPYGPNPGFVPPCPPVPQYDFQPCANTGDCPAGKLCYPMGPAGGQCFYPSC